MDTEPTIEEEEVLMAQTGVQMFLGGLKDLEEIVPHEILSALSTTA